MFKSVLRLFKLDREKFSVPRSVQKVLKIQQMWPDGVFRVGRKKYSKCFKFEDINYAVASHEDQELMFLQYSQVLNSLDPGAMTKLTINNHRINCSDLAQSVYMPMRGDGHDEMRKEYNASVIGGVIKHNSITQEKYVTISVHKNNVEEARSYFARIGAELISRFAALGSRCVEMDATERLRVFHNFFREGEENSFSFDLRS